MFLDGPITAIDQMNCHFSWLQSLTAAQILRRFAPGEAGALWAALTPRLATAWRLPDQALYVRISDLGPFRAARADVLLQLDLRRKTYGWAVEIV